MADKDYGPRLGADPELFIQDSEGKVIPICGKIGGTKEHPLVINHLVEARFGLYRPRRRGEALADIQAGNWAVQEDNVMLEFNVPAFKDSSFFTDSISRMLTVLEHDVLSQHGVMPKYEVMHTFKPEDIAPFPQAFTIGCLSDMNAYAENGAYEREPFSAAHFGNNRFCGGHLHVQYNPNNVPRHIFAQFMDLVAQLPYLRWDKQKMRRMFYGQPGLYREKPYGIEYRTPSNFWLSKTFRDKYLPGMVENIYSLAAFANKDPEFLKRIYSRIDWVDVQEAIRTENAKLADELVDYIRLKVGLDVGPVAAR